VESEAGFVVIKKECVYSPTNGSRHMHTINNMKDRQRTEIYKSNTTLTPKYSKTFPDKPVTICCFAVVVAPL